MRLPNGYGGVVYLGKRRRRPWAAKITVGIEKVEKDGKVRYRQKYRYLGYFEKKSDALTFLADYNRGKPIADNPGSNLPTFEDVYDSWLKYRCGLQKKPSDALLKNWGIAFNHFEKLHGQTFKFLKTKDYDECFKEHRHLSKSSIGFMKGVLRHMYDYALKYEMVEKDYSRLITAEFTESEEDAHAPFTDAEIAEIWKHKDEMWFVLVMIYTGLRASELCHIEVKNIFIEDRYMVGGMKTKAGTNRKIPIHEAILPLIVSHIDMGYKYLIHDTRGRAFTFTGFYSTPWRRSMDILGFDHKPHDTRVTCGTLMELAGIPLNRRKAILGHAQNDITEDIYTRIPIAELVKEINKIALPHV